MVIHIYFKLNSYIYYIFVVMSKANEACVSDIVLIPGVGFDIVPTDCLISMLYAKLPGATHLGILCSNVNSP